MNRKTIIALATTFALTAGQVALAAVAATATTAAIVEAMSSSSTATTSTVEIAEATSYALPLKVCPAGRCG